MADRAFRKAAGLRSITIEAPLTEISQFSFNDCANLESVTLPETVKSLGQHSFSQCPKLKSITGIDNVITIASYAFYRCSSLTDITLPSTLTLLQGSAFLECTSLERITIPGSVKELQASTFQDCIYNHRTTKTNQKLSLIHIYTGVSRARFRRLGCALAAAPMRTVAEYSYPFAGGIALEGNTVTVDTTAEGTPAPAAGEVAPGRRTYSAALQLDNITVLCNPRTETFRGWAPESFITRRSDSATGDWRCAISVKIASPGGDTVVCREIHGTGHAPEAFAPMLSYPSADAVEIAIDLTGADGHRSGLYPLTAVPGASLAVWASPGLEPFLPPAATVYAPPTSTVTPATVEQGVTEIHSSTDMRRTLSRRRIARSGICAVAPAPRGHSGWDFSRAKLLFFSEEGITLATVDAEGSFRATSRVDRRPVRSPLAVCHASDSAGAAKMCIRDSPTR